MSSSPVSSSSSSSSSPDVPSTAVATTTHKRSAEQAGLNDIHADADVHANADQDQKKDTKEEQEEEKKQEEEEDEEDENPCCICLDSVTLPISLPCRHVFCFLCIKSLNTSRGGDARCPLCRADIPAHALQNSHVSFADFERRLNERKRRRADATAAGKVAASEDDSMGVWKYAGRHSGWWLFDDRSNETIEEMYVKGVQWEREARITLSIRRQQPSAPVAPDGDGAAAPAGAAPAPADGAAAAAPPAPPASNDQSQQQQQPQQQQQQAQQQQANDDHDSDEEDDNSDDDDDDSDDDDDDSDDDDNHGVPKLNFGPPPNVDPLSGVNEAVALSQLDRLSIYNPHRACTIVVGANTYVIDLHLLQQYDARTPHNKRNIVRVPPESVRTEASSSRQSAFIKGQAGVQFQRTASLLAQGQQQR